MDFPGMIRRHGWLLALAWAGAASALTTNDWEFLQSIEWSNLRFFQIERHGPYKLIADSVYYDTSNNYPTVSSVAGTGFELTAIALGHYRGWISFSNAYEQALLQLRGYTGQLSADPDVLKRVNGWTYHWYNIADGKQNSPDGLSLLDHSLFVAGCIFVAEYFKGTEVAELAQRLYAETTWSWRPNSDYDFGYSENLLAVIESAAAPAFAKGADARTMWNSYTVPWPRQLQLYFWQYPHCWVDFRFRTDERGFNHADVARDSILYQRQRAIDLHAADPARYDMIGADVWGWSAAGASDGYRQMAPWELFINGETWSVERASDSGSITPCCLPPCVIYAPTETLAALKYIYDHFYIYGWDPGKGEMPVWNNTYGFLNCINKGRPWNSAKSNHFHGINAAIDYGPNVLMLENYKLGATWRWFMQNTNISAGMTTVGFGPTQQVWIATFSNQVNQFGGSHGTWGAAASTWAAIPTFNEYVRDYAVRITSSAAGSGGWVDLGNRDQRGAALLNFWIRGASGAEQIAVGLKDLFGVERKVPLSEYIAGSLGTNWALAKIPLEDFCLTGNVRNDVWPGNLALVSFEFTNAAGGTIEVDWVAFTKDTLAPRRPGGAFGVAMSGGRPCVTWGAADGERDVVGYHVWRRFNLTSGFTRVSTRLVPRHAGFYADQTAGLASDAPAYYAIQAFDNAEPANFSEFAFEKHVHGGRLDVDWNNGCNPNVFGGSADGYYGASTTQTFAFVNIPGPDGEWLWARRTMVSGAGAGHYIDLANGQAATGWALSVWARGAVGGEQLKLGLRDNWERERIVELIDRLGRGGLTTNWRRLVIRMAQFAGGDANALRNFSMTHGGSGAVYLAELGFLTTRPTDVGQLVFREAENWTSQQGSGGLDYKPAASGGEVLGYDWGIAAGSEACYAGVTTGPHTGAWVHLWYAIGGTNAAQVDVYLDGRRGARLVCPPTGGWGEHAAHFNRVAAFIGALGAGAHTVRLAAVHNSRPINLDCFSLNGAAPDVTVSDQDRDGLDSSQEIAAGTSDSLADSDGDGLEDGAELQGGRYGQVSDPARADSDADGMDDAAERVAGTDPLDAVSVFAFDEILRGTGRVFTVAWPVVSGRLYRLFYMDSALSNNAAFHEVSDPGNIRVTNGAAVYQDTGVTNCRCYRIDVRQGP